MKKYAFPLLIIGIIIASCSDGPYEDGTGQSFEEEQSLATLDTITLELNSNDKMQFDKNKLIVWSGQVVRLTLHHTGTMPKTSMGHNFVLIDSSISVPDYAKKAMALIQTEYVLEDPYLTLASTPLIGGGESTTVTFKAPSKGTYDFLCSFPGHYNIMKGKFIVK